MAADGYGSEAPEDFLETACVDAFLRGCIDKKAVLFAMERNPTTLDLALQCVKSSTHNQRILFGQKTESVKRVKFESDNESDVETSNLAVRVVNRQDKSFSYEHQNERERNVPKSSWQQNVDIRLKNTEKYISEIKSDISKVLQAVSTMSVGNRNHRSLSPARSPKRKTDSCFRCLEK